MSLINQPTSNFDVFSFTEAFPDRADDGAGGGGAAASVAAAQDGGRTVPDPRAPGLPQDNHQAGRFLSMHDLSRGSYINDVRPH